MPQRNAAANLLLVTNHLDAWGVTFIIVSTFMRIHDIRDGLLLLCITAMYWLGFAVNDYYDVTSDAINAIKARRNAFIQQPALQGIFPFIAWIVIGVALPGFALFGMRGMLLFGMSLGILWAYSAPPVRLKSRPLLDLFTHALFVQTYPYLLCLLLLAPPLIALDMVLLVAFALSSLGAQLEQQARDYDFDGQSERNFTTTFGKQTSVRLLKFITAMLFTLGLFSILTGILPLWIFPLCVIGLPPLLHRFIRKNSTRPERLIKLSVVVAMAYCLGWWIS